MGPCNLQCGGVANALLSIKTTSVALGWHVPGSAVLSRGPYANNEACQAVLQAAQGMAVVIQFTELSTEAGGDFVTVYDGPSDSSPQLWRGSGSSLPAAITSSGSAVLVTWTSDESLAGGGWRLTYAATGMAPLLFCVEWHHMASCWTCQPGIMEAVAHDIQLVSGNMRLLRLCFAGSQLY